MILTCMVLNILFAGCFLQPALCANSSVSQVLIDNQGTYSTKRIWLYNSDSRFQMDGYGVAVSLKESLFSRASSYVFPQTIKNFSTGLYYYIDVPIEFECFKVGLVKSDDLSYAMHETEWVCDINPAALYQITPDVTGGIRPRNADLGFNNRPDAFILGTLLDAYVSYSPSYENGFAAFESLNENWFKHYVGRRGDDALRNTYVCDYTEEEVLSGNYNNTKTRLISVEDKIEELSALFASKKGNRRRTATRNIIFSIVSAAGAILASTVLLWVASYFSRRSSNKSK